jgi:hypothetical protein
MAKATNRSGSVRRDVSWRATFKDLVAFNDAARQTGFPNLGTAAVVAFETGRRVESVESIAPVGASKRGS